MENPFRNALSGIVLCIGLLATGACTGGVDIDLRDSATGLTTSDAARQAATGRWQADENVAFARQGETVADLANRLGIDPKELADYNGLKPDTRLREREVLALPESAAGGPGTPPSAEEVDISSLASDALDRVEAETGATGVLGTGTGEPIRTTPIRHQVVRGETAYSIARLYKVSVRSLADWNGLGPELSVREGQYLIIPNSTASEDSSSPEQTTSAPGEGSLTPVPPSASMPLPEETPEPALAAQDQPEQPPAGERSAVSRNARLAMPVNGDIVRAYERGKNDGVDIAADVGSPVVAAGEGTVAVITVDTDLGTILVIRHSEDLLTVYANVDNLKVQQGEAVSRGQDIAEIGEEAGYLHFEVREGMDSVDPLEYLN